MKTLGDIKILVVGDIMLDKYVVGDVERISAEAPVPIVHVKEEYSTLGGSGNVVRNLCELGCQVDCLASVGPDLDGQTIGAKLTEIGAKPLLFFGSKKSIVKERVIADQRKVQMIRIDREDIQNIEAKYPIDIFVRMNANQAKYDFVIVSDYAKGMITRELMNFLKREQNAKIIVDPKPTNAGMYDGVYMITPNEKEWSQMLFSSAYTLSNVPYILVTKGSKGMTLLDETDEGVDISTEEVKVYNVSGCGDVVVAIMTACLSSGYSPLTSAKIANKCAGYTASLPGTSIIKKQKFHQFVKEVLSIEI